MAVPAAQHNRVGFEKLISILVRFSTGNTG
jgi:hypothetical protein